jgi:hypothetical protein
MTTSDVRTFASLDELARTLPSGELFRESDLRGFLAQTGLNRARPTPTAAAGGTLGMIVSPAHWVIADDDLKLLESLISTLQGALAGLATLDLRPVAVAILLSAFRFAQACRQKGVRLQAGPFATLAALVSSEHGLSLSELARHLHHTEAVVLEDLDSLQNVVPRDGTKKAFVIEDAAGRWHASGV